MSDVTNERADKARRTKKTLVASLLGGLAGFAGAFLFLTFVESGTLPAIGASREIAGLIAILYFLMGLFIAFGLLSPKQGAKLLNVEDAEEIAEEKTELLYGTIVMIVSAVALMVLALAAPVGPVGRTVALIIYVLASIITIYCSFAAQKQQDELMREVGKECSVMGFYLLFAVGGTWSVLAHLDYVAAPAPLDWLSLFWGLTLLAAFVVTGRRGLLTTR